MGKFSVLSLGIFLALAKNVRMQVPDDECCCESRPKCHCAGKEACDAKTDACPNGCAEGWKSVRCDISYPYLRSPPSLLSAHPNSLDIQLPSSEEPHLGDGNPMAYILQVKNPSSEKGEWTKMNTIYSLDSFETIKDLKPGTSYAVRVVIEDQDGHAQQELAPIAIHSTSEYFGKATCDSDSRAPGCLIGKICTVTCVSPCSTPGDTSAIWGTGVSQYDAKVCRSAVHAYRLASYASSETDITYVRVAGDTKKYLPTIQRGIVSNPYRQIDFPERGLYYFTSPYITEDILDVATLNYKYLYTEREHFIQTCFTTRPINFQFYIPPFDKKHGDRSSMPGSERVSWKSAELQPGGYWCDLINNTYSNVMSLAMAAEADFRPDQWTVTTSIHETVLIRFTSRHKVSTLTSVTWRKDKNALYSFSNMKLSQNNNQFTLEIADVEFGDGGIYSLEFTNEKATQGIMRLIVRRCSSGNFGPTCKQWCPICQNGGVCHDIMGKCICPPGYSGKNCEITCEADTFGKNCSHSCASSKNTDAIDNSCKGALICLPDPYGCSCGAGFTGLACDQLAIEGTIDKTFKEIMASREFNPYLIPTTKVKIGLKTAELYEGKLVGLKNLRRTGNSDQTNFGSDSTLEFTFGGNGFYIQGMLDNAGPFGKISIRVDTGFVNMMAKVLMPSQTEAKPKLLDLDILTIDGIQVTQEGGTSFENESINMMLAMLGSAYPSMFKGIVESVLRAFAASFVQKLTI